jgi:hypothetical protein
MDTLTKVTPPEILLNTYSIYFSLGNCGILPQWDVEIMKNVKNFNVSK